ncbi:MAG TPA: MarR family transcriptional regulator [Candidatus Blautia merdavium]|uniref:MarR family transcriptional regulator n=1 Tax=Candidatus Blautia merdavium TaxID=2838494 RepID=A0A9D2PN43_9FIRM|nr:MarR family transcriptional regulator [Candidatus Blautia merdavium]
MQRRTLGKSISVLYRREQRYVNQMLKEYGLGYSDYNFLMYLSANEGCSQKEMSQAMSVDEALTVRVVRKLQKQGYIIRSKAPQNSRRYEIYLTEEGKELIPKLRSCLTSWWDQVTEGMPWEEQEVLIRGMEVLEKQSERLMEEP